MTRNAYLWPVAVLITGAFVAIALLASPDGFAQVAPAGGDVAVCDVAQIFNQYDRANDLTDDFAKRRDAIVEEGKKRAGRIEALKEELSGYKPGEDDYEELVQEIQRQAIEAQAWQEYKLTIVGRDHHRLTTEMYEEILNMVETVAVEQGYKLVLFRETRDTTTENMNQLLAQMESRKVLYSSPSVDITQTVLARLNRQYKANRP